MGTLRYAMLGLIQRAPATGYDISKAFSGRLGSIWERDTVRSIQS